MPYRRMLDSIWPAPAASLEQIPYLPIGLFKSHRLVSVSDDQVAVTLTSSGATGQEVSRVYLDRATAQRQTLALECRPPGVGAALRRIALAHLAEPLRSAGRGD